MNQFIAAQNFNTESLSFTFGFQSEPQPSKKVGVCTVKISFSIN